MRVLRWRQSAEDCCKTWLGQDSTNGQNVHMCGHRAALARHFSVPKLVLGSRDFTLCGIITTKLEQMLLFECSSRALLACKLSCKLFLIGTGTICRRLLQGTEFIYTAAASKATEGVVLTWMFWETVRRQVRSDYASCLEALGNYMQAGWMLLWFRHGGSPKKAVRGWTRAFEGSRTHQVVFVSRRPVLTGGNAFFARVQLSGAPNRAWEKEPAETQSEESWRHRARPKCKTCMS